MKKVIKSRIFLVIITMIIVTSVSVYAATTYKATDVVYNASDGTSKNVGEALNELYEKTSAANSGSTKLYSFTSPKGEYSYSFNLSTKIKTLTDLDYTKLTKNSFYVVTNGDVWLRWKGSQDQTNFTPSSTGFASGRGIISYDASSGTLKAGLYLYYQPYASSYGNMDFGFDIYVIS